MLTGQVSSEGFMVDLVWPGEVERAEGTRVLRLVRRVLLFVRRLRLARGLSTGILVRRQLTEIPVRIFVCRRTAGVLSRRGPAR